MAVPGWHRPRARAQIVGYLAVAVALAIGHHFFYHDLAGRRPDDASISFEYASLGFGPQQLNLAIGSAFAFMVKAFLGMAVTTAQEQAVWSSIRKTPTKNVRIDGMFAAPTSLYSILNFRNWGRGFWIMFIAMLYWLLPISAFFTPATLTVQFQSWPSTASTRVPRVDFTSLNFAIMVQDGPLDSGYATYSEPRFHVRRVVAAAMTEGQILGISPPASNSSWTTSFPAPSISCSLVNATYNKQITTNIYAGADGTAKQYGFLAWAPTEFTCLPFIYSSQTNKTSKLQSATLSSLQPNCAPYLSLFVAALPAGLNDPLINNTNGWVDKVTVAQCVLQNSSYVVDFAYLDGVQAVNVSINGTYNPVNLTTGFNGYDIINYGLNSSDVERISYQAVMEAYNEMLVGAIQYSDNKLAATSPVMNTALANTAELLAINTLTVSPYVTYNDSSLTLGNLGSHWNGTSITQTSERTAPMIDLLEKMFQNATISLMSSYLLQPNYTSPFAPPNTTVTYTPHFNTYVYSSSILFTAYGIAILFALFSALLGFFAVHANRGTYSTKFSTMMRVAHIVHLSSPVLIDDADGRDPVPRYVDDIVVSFPGRDSGSGSGEGQNSSWGQSRNEKGGGTQSDVQIVQVGGWNPDEDQGWRGYQAGTYVHGDVVR